MNSNGQASEALAALIGDETGDGRALLIVGPPRSGKTGFAMRALLDGLEAFGAAGAAMAVSGRVTADDLGNRVIRRIGVSPQARPVTTLSALAFRVLSDAAARDGRPAPRLLNGAEQDVLLRQVLAVHLSHAQKGDDCATCVLLRSYFASDDWSQAVVGGIGAGEEPGEGANVGQADASHADGATTLAVLARGVSDAFIAQLRDMLARMDELGVTMADADGLLDRMDAGPAGQWTVAQWRLAFALRSEYERAVEHSYPGQWRLDASRLLVEGEKSLRHGGAQMGGLRLMVVDDLQDTTLAGLRFLEALAGVGTRLVLVGNPDEAVQTFRGSYPEYLFMQVRRGPLKAEAVQLEDAAMVTETPDYRALVASRVSLSIPSPEAEELPLAARPGKLPRFNGALPIIVLPADDGRPVDGSLRTALYRSPREELDDIVWRIKRAHLDGQVEWNDMALIAHDNATVRAFGEQLRRDGVPVRYSSVTRPLKEEPFVQGLFALIELAQLRRQGIAGHAGSLASIATTVRRCALTLMGSPLVTAGGKPGEGRAARVEPVLRAMESLESLGGILEREQLDGRSSVAPLERLWDQWGRLRGKAVESQDHVNQNDGAVQVDDRLMNPSDDETMGFGVDALWVMLGLDDDLAPAADALAVIVAVLGPDPQARAFSRIWSLLDDVAAGLGKLQEDAPQYALAVAWQAAGVAGSWQRQALENTAEGRTANDRLDVAMRLFQFAEGFTAGHDIGSFIAQVRSMQLEADSLAHVGPVEQAVTLTTPAGAAGRHWRFVWMPALQQDVWPNLAERSTLFGGEDMADMVLRGGIARTTPDGHDPRQSDVLSSEKKSLLVALTRADERVEISATWNDELAPSDFLFAYLPERFQRDRDHADFVRVGVADGQDDNATTSGLSFGLDADPRGLVAAARVALLSHPDDDMRCGDAADALALLAAHGIEEADPDAWNFPSKELPNGAGKVGGVSGVSEVSAGPKVSAPDNSVVTLSPSSADGLWGCPVCWLLENRLSGPKAGSIATGFGSLIHEVAQRGSEEGLDLPDVMAGQGLEERVSAVAERLTEIYERLRDDPQDIADPARRYDAMRKDAGAADALHHLASYFAGSNESDYLGGNAKFWSVGRLEHAECEVEFAARFTMNDVLAAYRALSGAALASRSELSAFMGALVGGWPEGMREDLTVRLSGRIDRKETRVLDDGSRIVRLIDYKTGQKPSGRQIVNDLQLVCYQLGLAFPEGRAHDGPASVETPNVSSGMLFHLNHHDAPAESRAPEGLFQPPILVDGHLNDDPFTARYYYKTADKILDLPVLGNEPPEGIGQEAWDGFQSLSGTQSLWALTMIARVFYAAAASRSARLMAHPTDWHLEHCRLKYVCPACAGQSDTIFETRQP